MALNQTQRDHAIKMIETAISTKKNALSITALSETDFIEAHLKNSKIKSISISDLRRGTCNDRWGNYGFSMLKALGLEEAREAHQADVKQTNDLRLAGLRQLEEQLKGEVMFSNDYSVIAEALEKIANFE